MKPRKAANIVGVSRIKAYQIQRDLKVNGLNSRYLSTILKHHAADLGEQAERVEKIMAECPYDKLTVRRINDKLKKTRPRLE